MEAQALQLVQLGVGALTGVDLDVAAGETVCLSGPSGSGKTRLLRAVADLEPHAGRVCLGQLEQAATPANQWRRAVMMVPAESQWWHERVGAHFARPMPQALADLGFESGVEDWPVMRLSSGEKQRLALVRAVSTGPRALLLDEPTANLDDASAERVETWLTRLIHERCMPTLWVAHSAAQIARVADRHLRVAGSRLEVAA